MQRVKVVVAISEPEVRSRVVAALSSADDVELNVLSGPRLAHLRQASADVLIVSPGGIALPGEEPDRFHFHRERTVMVAYRAEALLESAFSFGYVDGWIAVNGYNEGARDLVILGREHYAVLPRVLDLESGLDSIRLERFESLPVQFKSVLAEVSKGATNLEIAERLGMSVEQVALSLKHSTASLGLRGRVQAAVFFARYCMDDGKPDNDLKSGSAVN